MPATLPLRSPDFVPAVLSDCRRFRYELRREVSPGSWSTGPLALWCGANPSKADAFKDDHTIRKELGFTRAWGCSGFIKVNLLAWRETNPKKVPGHYLSTGREHALSYWRAALANPRVSIVVAAWGDCLKRHVFAQQQAELFDTLAKDAGHDLKCLGRTALGNPKHPLMLPYSTPLEWW